MRPFVRPFPALLALAAALAGCASVDSQARYDQSLAKWKGASSRQLVASWGEPQRVETLPGTTRALTWVVHHDLENQGRLPDIVVAPASGNIIAMPGPPMAPVVPVTCTTRFVLVDDAVVSWSFDGVACGAPP